METELTSIDADLLALIAACNELQSGTDMGADEIARVFRMGLEGIEEKVRGMMGE
ncbi:MAG: hypothetical protein J6D53_00340 [Blautia sp.]|nr:hypothetical protein [Blautia sp.]